jgi:cytochrome c oxidase assembly protein subunit 11
METSRLPPPPQHGRLVAAAAAGGRFFFAFGFALVPLYDTLCEATGFNGKTHPLKRTAIAAKDLRPARQLPAQARACNSPAR